MSARDERASRGAMLLVALFFAAVGMGLGGWVIARKLVWDYGIMGWPSPAKNSAPSLKTGR